MDANTAQAGMWDAVALRPGFDGDQIGAMARVEMGEAVFGAKEGLDISGMMAFSAKLGSSGTWHWDLSVGSCRKPRFIIMESTTKLPAKGVRFVSVPMRDECHDASGQLGNAAEAAVLQDSALEYGKPDLDLIDP